jgi:hypothetical protein
MRYMKKKARCIVAIPLQQSMPLRRAVLCHTYISCLFGFHFHFPRQARNSSTRCVNIVFWIINLFCDVTRNFPRFYTRLQHWTVVSKEDKFQCLYIWAIHSFPLCEASVVSMLASGTQDRGRSRRIFFGRKIPQHAYLRKGSKAVCPVSQICGT